MNYGKIDPGRVIGRGYNKHTVQSPECGEYNGATLNGRGARTKKIFIVARRNFFIWRIIIIWLILYAHHAHKSYAHARVLTIDLRRGRRGNSMPPIGHPESGDQSAAFRSRTPSDAITMAVAVMP